VEDRIRALSIKYVVLIGIGLPILYYFFYFKPPNELALITDYEQQLVQLDGEIKKLDREISEGDQIKKNLELIKKEIKALATFFEIKPNSKSIEQIISIEARAAGISFTSLQKAANNDYGLIQEPANPGGGVLVTDFIQRSLIEANFTGSFIELMRFLAYLSRTDRIISLKKIELRGGPSERTYSPSGLKLTFKADFETYEIVKDVNAETLAPAPEAPAEGEVQ
jgi:Tfp pilus assembly protein PilO